MGTKKQVIGSPSIESRAWGLIVISPTFTHTRWSCIQFWYLSLFCVSSMMLLGTSCVRRVHSPFSHTVDTRCTAVSAAANSDRESSYSFAKMQLTNLLLNGTYYSKKIIPQQSQSSQMVVTLGIGLTGVVEVVGNHHNFIQRPYLLVCYFIQNMREESITLDLWFRLVCVVCV